MEMNLDAGCAFGSSGQAPAATDKTPGDYKRGSLRFGDAAFFFSSGSVE
jgi:hypothetical protein